MSFLSDSNKIADELRRKKNLRQASDVPDALAEFNRLPNSAYVRLPMVGALYCASPSSVWRWVKSGHIPAPHKLGPNTTAWNVGELRASLKAKSWAPKDVQAAQRSAPIHNSDCAVHNEPAMPAGPCDCGVSPAGADQ